VENSIYGVLLSVHYSSIGSFSHGTRSIWSFDFLRHCLVKIIWCEGTTKCSLIDNETHDEYGYRFLVMCEYI
jgi:hypothetical protein